MSITLGNVTFDSTHTTVHEKLEEVGGRDERSVKLSGAIVGESTVDAIEARLDAILDAASVENYGAELCLRPGRRLLVRRDSFEREVAGESLVGSFELRLEARLPYEESQAVNTVLWAISASGASLAVSSAGNLAARPIIALAASGAVVNPSFNDGVSAISYSGVVSDGETLIFDAEAKRVELEGMDVTPYTSGVFPEIADAGTTLVYEDDATSSHSATVQVSFRDRWW